MACVGAWLGCVEVDQARAVYCFCVIYETRRIFWMVRKGRKKCCSVIVVADQQAHRAWQIGQGVNKGRIGRRLAPMGQVAGDDNPRGVAMLGAHIIERLGKTPMGVQSAHAFAGDRQVNVRDVDKFHSLDLSWIRIRPPQAGATGIGLAVWQQVGDFFDQLLL